MIARRSYPQHLTDQELIQLLDGELDQKRAVVAREHLESCWNCRWRADRKREAISRLVEYCNWTIETLGPPPDQWRGFRDRVNAERASANWASDADDRPALIRLWGSFRQRLAFVPNRLAAAQVLGARSIAVAVSIFAVLWWCFSEQAPAARAAEILSQAELREANQAIPSHLASFESVEVSSGNRHAVWNIWQSPSRGEIQRTYTGDASMAARLDEIYRRSGRESETPLSAAVFGRWSRGPKRRVAGIQDDPSSASILIRIEQTDAREPGTIRESVLTIRKSDFRASGESLRVATKSGDCRIQVREISYLIVPYEQTPLFKGAPAPRRTVNAEKPPSRERMWTESELQNAEADLRLALHKLNADISPVPEIRRAGHCLELELLVDGEDKKLQIQHALSGLPQVTAVLWSPDEVPRQTFESPSPQSQSQVLNRVRPLRLHELEKCLGSEEKAGLYIDEVHAQLRAALVPALEVERLANRYPDPEFARVPIEGKAALDELAADHLRDFRERWNRLSALVQPQMAGCFAATVRTPPDSASLAPTWRDDGKLLAPLIRRLRMEFDLLFVTQEITTSGFPPPAAEGGHVAELQSLADTISRLCLRPLSPAPGTNEHAAR